VLEDYAQTSIAPRIGKEAAGRVAGHLQAGRLETGRLDLGRVEDTRRREELRANWIVACSVRSQLLQQAGKRWSGR